MTTDDPWGSISPPARDSLISARRVTQMTLWGLFWAVDADNNLLLILQHRKGSSTGESATEISWPAS